MSYGIKRFFLLTCCLACSWSGLEAKIDLQVVRQWKKLEFNFPNDATRKTAIEKRFYVPGKCVPIDMDFHDRQDAQKSRIFVTIPRFGEGCPVTLGTVDDQGHITGYPDYSWHDNQGKNCKGLTSVYRVAIDKCNRLWVMDAGKIGSKQHCPPQLLAFDLSSDRLVYRHVVNASNYVSTSLLITPVVDVIGTSDNCKDTFVYVADALGFGILVVDVANDRSWRVTHRFMYPYPSHGSFKINDDSFDLMSGVFGMALSPYQRGRDRYLYFHALSSTTENIVSTKVLRNDSFLQNPNAEPRSIKVLPGERPNQSAAEAMDRNGILYYGIMDPPSIWCWNSATEFSPRNFHQIAVNRETLQFASGVKVVNNRKGEQELWVITSRFQKFLKGTIDSKAVNYRIHAAKIPNLFACSSCPNSPKSPHIPTKPVIPNTEFLDETLECDDLLEV
ncbi:hypothetical protein ABMA27_014679 [Loxostege sticticalis]|uniref:Yellow-d n=1 Tax=Loxostege sticticalis TaxID=481309 RepID=A0ABR3I9S4_LOXSC